MLQLMFNFLPTCDVIWSENYQVFRSFDGCEKLRQENSYPLWPSTDLNVESPQ
mgnify:CR=1 FL=1